MPFRFYYCKHRFLLPYTCLLFSPFLFLNYHLDYMPAAGPAASAWMARSACWVQVMPYYTCLPAGFCTVSACRFLRNFRLDFVAGYLPADLPACLGTTCRSAPGSGSPAVSPGTSWLPACSLACHTATCLPLVLPYRTCRLPIYCLPDFVGFLGPAGCLRFLGCRSRGFLCLLAFSGSVSFSRSPAVSPD